MGIYVELFNECVFKVGENDFRRVLRWVEVYFNDNIRKICYFSKVWDIWEI